MPQPTALSDTMVTAALVISGGAMPDAYLPEIERLLAGRFRYFEIMAVVSGLDEAGLKAAEARISGRRNGRLVVLDGDPSPERLSFAAASESLGDYVVVIHPDEIAPAEALHLLVTATGGNDLVRIRLAPSARPLLDRVLTSMFSRALRALTGRRVRGDIGRSVCLSRSAAASVRDQHLDGRFLRFVEGPGQVAAGVFVSFPGARRMGRPRDYYRRSLLGFGLIGQATPRILRGVALLAFLLSVASLGFGGYAAAVWLFSPGVAQGWTSLSIVMSTLFSSLFLVLGFLCIGMVRVFELLAGQRPYRIEREVSSLDIFRGLGLLNVETAEAEAR